MWSPVTIRLIEAACTEDVGSGDITSALLPGGANEICARVVCRQTGVVAGLALGPEVCRAFARRLGTGLTFEPVEHAGGPGGTAQRIGDGDEVAAGQTLATLRGPQAAVLATERTLLNFLGRLSGVASLTRRFVVAARSGNPAVQVLDTRKTLPGWRELDKYAVRCGGGANHRAGLYDAVLIKDNHLAGMAPGQLAGELARWLSRLPAHPPPHFVEVEVDRLEQLTEVGRVPAVDIVLLDNFGLDELRAAVAWRAAEGLAPRAAGDGGDAGRRVLLLEASGGVRLDNIAAIAATGVDRVSVGALTHSAVSMDIGLDV